MPGRKYIHEAGDAIVEMAEAMNARKGSEFATRVGALFMNLQQAWLMGVLAGTVTDPEHADIARTFIELANDYRVNIERFLVHGLSEEEAVEALSAATLLHERSKAGAALAQGAT